MVSIISGYNYDIFISYRQKDNKGDRWVSEFVEVLKTELESTFKEEISVYFDINPHDGLLETHDVDASLKEKLKCLVFIPIISRTYCDPKSFAWEHEFKTFVELASKDQYGLKVKLPNGNVASRVLPVRIHDLNQEDIRLCESVLGGVLRGIEFIYKEPGVNKPLTADDDENRNLNKTKYSIQVNKLANAINAIISGIINPELVVTPERIKVKEIQHGRRKISWKKIAIPTVILVVLLIAGVFFLPSVIKKLSGSSFTGSKSIAVLPFDNLSNDPDQEYFSVGMVDEILDKLFKIGGLKVIARTSSERFKNSNLPLKEIAHKLGVDAIMEGSVRKMGNEVKITVKLIDARSESHIWSEIYNKDISDIFLIQSQVAQNVAKELKTIITPEAKRLIDKKPTTNMSAYEAYWRGMYYHRKLNRADLEIAMKYFELAKEKDPQFALAYAGIGRVWRGLQQMNSIKVTEGAPKAEAAVERAIELDSTYSEIYHLLGGIRTWTNWDWKGGDASFRKAIELNPQNADAHTAYSHCLLVTGKYDEAMKHIAIALDLDPMNSKVKSFYGIILFHMRRYNEAVKAFHEARDLDPSQGLVINIIPALHLVGRDDEAIEMMKKFWNEQKYLDAINAGYKEGGFRGAEKKLADVLVERSKTEYIAANVIAVQYALAENINNAIQWLEKSYEEHSPNLPYISSPVYDILRDNIRFQEIVKKMRFPY